MNMTRVPLLDIPATYPEILKDIEEAVSEVIRSGHFILGPKVGELEEKIADYCGTGFAVGVSSGTDALLISLMACGIGPGDEVITTPFTFFATAGCISRTGGRPVFVDIDPETFNIDPALLKDSITDNTRAIIPVHLYGQCADMEAVSNIAKDSNLTIIEDAAQAIGSEFKNKRAGLMGDFGCFSFFPSKNLGGFGDGGMVTTRSENNLEKLKTLRVHGSNPKYYHKIVGGNFRLDTLQAAVVLAKLKYLGGWNDKRRENAQRYSKLFEQQGLLDHIQIPREVFPKHTFNQYVIRVEKRRDELKNFLQSKNIATEIYYPLPLHLQECFKDLGYRSGQFPVAEKAAREVLALPVSHEVTPQQQEYVVETIKDFFQ